MQTTQSSTRTGALTRGGQFGAYRPSAEAYDEMLDGQGALRGHWQEYIRSLESLGPDELNRRWTQAGRLIQENGVTYNVYGDPRGVNRPWAMDPIPQILSEEDWRILEEGLTQRAVLLNRLLADIYGSQHLLHDGGIPPEFLFANNCFLRPCHGMRPPSDIYLHFGATDVIRCRDGRWRAVADRTQAPSGAGYSLENRIVMSRALPTLIRDCPVQRLGWFFERLRDTLREIAPHNRENPTIVLLTPGPFNETYFEHSYLARYLGFTLAEGEDLTVRDNCVFLKTLEGLMRVDVILRRIDDHFCDPLEFYCESTLGVAGLMQAAQSGNVAVANALGSGVLEAPALRAILPGLARRVLGEDLKLESVRTWWCADPDQYAYVRDHFDELVIEPAFPARGWEPIYAGALSSSDRAALLARVAEQPFAFVAQEMLRPSTAPVWTDAGLQPRSMVMRTYAAASAHDTFHVMTGGLTRFAMAEDSLVVSMQRGGGSKDTWVRTKGPVNTVSLLPPPGHPIDINRSAANLPSRAGDNLFWLGRYAERAEAAVRKVRCVLMRLTEEPGAVASPEFLGIARLLADAAPPNMRDALTAPLPDLNAIDRVIADVVFNDQCRGSIASTFSDLQRVAWIVRDRLSLDTWRILSRLTEQLPVASVRQRAMDSGETLVVLNQLVVGMAAFSGLAMENMTRGQGWSFLDMGRRVERSVHTLDMLRNGLVNTGDHEGAMLLAILEIADSAMTYRSRYGVNVQAPAVLDLLLTDSANPRSVAFQIDALAGHLEKLPQPKAYPFVGAERQILERIATDLRLLDIFAVCQADDRGIRTQLDSRLLDIARLVPDASEALAQRFFSHTGPSRQLAALRPEAGR